MSQFRDHFSSVAASYAAFRPHYPKELFAYLASMAPQKFVAWDCACGNGQATKDLAVHFKKVIGTDGSPQQINAAAPHPNIEYKVAPAENSSLAENSVDLVTVAQALHWFPIEAFYTEARRVLRPHGVLAVWCYGATHVESAAIDELVQDFHYNRIGPYWPPGREIVEEGYRTLPFPFPEITTPQFEMTARWNLQQLLGYFSSWSGTKRYIESNGKSPLPQLEAEMLTVWSDPSTPQTIRWPVSLRCGHKP
ncbi:MAG TPA: class I SAM-dependent methyltransferase [Verrucomicrobiae bacterium]|nr:class I SAM-dependent methyltransferase [Verrucomicrobiae bacterium]